MSELKWYAVKSGGMFKKDEFVPISASNIRQLQSDSKIIGYMPMASKEEYKDKKNDERRLFLKSFEQRWEEYKKGLLPTT